MTETPSITVIQVLAHLYCPCFTYFEHVLALPDQQERFLCEYQRSKQNSEPSAPVHDEFCWSLGVSMCPIGNMTIMWNDVLFVSRR